MSKLQGIQYSYKEVIRIGSESMELRVLRYFLTVAREQNITKAAEVLHITQPTLSRQLMQLEDELGKKLFERGKGQITLTSDGMLLRRRAQELLELADKTEREFKDNQTLLEGELFIGSGETYLFHYLTSIMKDFSKAYPQVQYNLFSGNADDIKEKVNSGLIDVALLTEPVDLQKYEFIRLPKKDRWGIILPANDPLAQKEVITPEDLRHASIICSKRSLVHDEIEHWFKDVFTDIQEIGKINLIHNATMMVEDGLGYAITLEHLIPNYEGSPICFRPFSPVLETGSVLAWKKHQVFSLAATKFIEYIKYAFQA